MKTQTLICAAALVLGCKPDAATPKPDPPEKGQTIGATEQPTETNATESSGPGSVQPHHYVFVGKPNNYRPMNCQIWDEPHAPRHRAPLQMKDATHFPQRFKTMLELVEVTRDSNTKPLHIARPDETGAPAKQNIKVAFAVAPKANMGKDAPTEASAYSIDWCERVNSIMTSEFAVVHGYNIYVDHGNSGFLNHNDVGTDPDKQSAGFKTLDEAKAHAKKLTEPI